MIFPELPDSALADAIGELRRHIAQYLPSEDARQEADSAINRVEQYVARSTALHGAAVGDSCDGVFVMEPAEGELRWIYVNPSFARMTGLRPESLAGSLLSETPETTQLQAGCLQAMAAGRPVDFDDRRDRPDGSVELKTRLTPVRDSDGVCLRIVGVCRDVTDQRKSERHLRKQSRRLGNILDSISDGFVVTDREWRVTFLNARAEQILGGTRAALSGTLIWEALSELQLDVLRKAIEITGARHGARSSDIVVHEGGRWLSVRAYPSQEGTAIYLQDISDCKRAEQALKQGLEQMQTSLEGIVNAMAFAIEMRDPYTGGHQRRVSALACAIARQMGFPVEQIETLRIAGLLHDIGKISIPAEILNRPGKLSEAERIIVRTHAQIGYEILKEIEFASPIALIALQHHERLDGSGYPQGIQADAIIPEARILAVADVVEAMASHRPYRPALGVEAALKEVMAHRGLQYDDVAVGACLSAFAESGFDFDQLMQTEMSRRVGFPEVGSGRNLL